MLYTIGVSGNGTGFPALSADVPKKLTSDQTQKKEILATDDKKKSR